MFKILSFSVFLCLSMELMGAEMTPMPQAGNESNASTNLVIKNNLNKMVLVAYQRSPSSEDTAEYALSKQLGFIVYPGEEAIIYNCADLRQLKMVYYTSLTHELLEQAYDLCMHYRDDLNKAMTCGWDMYVSLFPQQAPYVSGQSHAIRSFMSSVMKIGKNVFVCDGDQDAPFEIIYSIAPKKPNTVLNDVDVVRLCLCAFFPLAEARMKARQLVLGRDILALPQNRYKEFINTDNVREARARLQRKWTAKRPDSFEAPFAMRYVDTVIELINEASRNPNNEFTPFILEHRNER